MSPPHPLLIRTATSIQTRYVAHANRTRLVTLPRPAWDECVRAVRLLHYARHRGWMFAAERLTFRVRNACRALGQEFNRIDDLLKPRTPPDTVPSLRNLYDELVALYDEYETVRIDRRTAALAVRTDPIVLDGMGLGPFEIQLCWSALPESQCYSVVALQPNRSGGEGYTHPHVLNERLCEGDGRLPIQRALAEGRLGDFFQIVTRVMDSYNSESAYCQLEDWDGRDCVSCGHSVSGDETYLCARCGDPLCFDCYERCDDCDETFCSQCVTPCASCEDVYCRGCLHTCPQCRGETCDTCRQPDQRCRNCTGADATEEPVAGMDSAGPAVAGQAATTAATSAPEEDPARRAAAAVHAGGVGQACVPA